jgi:hypothetical protein
MTHRDGQSMRRWTKSTHICRFGTIGNSVGETPGRVQIARF